MPPDDRASRLAILAESDPGLARELLELLVAGERDPVRLELPALDRLAGIEESSAPPPTVVGSYRIVREIGRGGMGRVFLAEQETPAFRRRVALKLLDATELNAEAVRRFRDEVRILASLEHPGIARFLDGGRTDAGIWFLALEYVEGEDLLTAARRSAHSLEEDIRLFIAVLDAVAYAHDRHVVHRDLKPSNILVTHDGVPKLLDFGISKLFDPLRVDNATLTRTELRAFTPAYASPEQFRGETAGPGSDVYSAGVLLYELLTGVRPHGSRSSSRVELERAVLEEDPEPPSTAARRSADGTLDIPSASWRATPPRLGRDLDAICLKALRREPAARYASAAEFAADLRRYLKNVPITAHRGEWRYRLERLGRKNPAVTAVLGVLAAALVVELVALTGSPGRFRAATSGPAEEPAPRPFPFSSGAAPSVEESDLLFAAAPASVEAGAAYALALQREGRVKEASLVVARLRQIPGKEDDPLTDYVDAVGALDANQPQRALVLLTRALDSASARGRGELVAQIRATRGRLYSTMGRREEARSEMEQARAAFVAAGDKASLARVLNDLAIEEAQRGDLAKAEELFEEALAATRAVSPNARGAAFLGNLANLAAARGHPDLAELRYVEAIAIARESGRPFRPGFQLGELSEVLRDLGRPAEASLALNEALVLLRRAGDRAAIATALSYLGRAAIESGQPDGVLAIVEEIDAIAASTGATEPLALAEALTAELALAAGDLVSARWHFVEGARLLHATSSADDAPELELRLAEVDLAAGDVESAGRTVERAISPLRGRGERATLLLGEALLARVKTAAHRPREARRHLAALGEGAEHSPSFRLRLAFLNARGAIYAGEGNRELARADFAAAIELAQKADWRQVEKGLRRELAAVERSPAAGVPARL
jgi:serine/threonine protein kinase